MRKGQRMRGNKAADTVRPSGSRVRARFAPIVASLVVVAGAALGVVAVAAPAGADTVSFSSAQYGTSGTTPSFSQTGPWTLAWTYNCANVGGIGVFSVTVNQPASSTTFDTGADELGSGGSGTDHYYDTGSFTVTVTSLCNWTMTVAPASGAPLGTPLTLTSDQVGNSGQTASFSVTAPWTMAWSYNCASLGEPGPFSIFIDQPLGGLSGDSGPDLTGTGGSGVDSYSNVGTFSLGVISACPWSVTITSTAPAPAPAPTPAPTAAPAPAPAPAPPAGSVFSGMASTPDGGGYWIVDRAGDVAAKGDAVYHGSMTGQHLNAPIAHIVATPDGGGYWLVAADGGIFSFGDAPFYGSMGGKRLNAPVVGLAPTPDGHGYWLVATDGGIFAFGDAPFYGSMGGAHLNKPVVGIAADPATGGYWLVATDGGIFSFHAPFFGSTGNIHLNQPINGMAATPDGGGYRFVASDGGIFDEGDATFFGSTGNLHLNAPIVGMATDPATGGYWLVGSDGGIFTFHAPFEGSAA